MHKLEKADVVVLEKVADLLVGAEVEARGERGLPQARRVALEQALDAFVADHGGDAVREAPVFLQLSKFQPNNKAK